MAGQAAKEGVAAVSKCIKKIEMNTQTASNGSSSGEETNQQVNATNRKQQR